MFLVSNYDRPLIELETMAEAEQEVNDIVSDFLPEALTAIKRGVKKLAYKPSRAYGDLAEYIDRAIKGEPVELLAEEAIRDYHFVELLADDEEE